jgi:hypothetical protein
MMTVFKKETRIAPELEWLEPETLPGEMKKTRPIEIL